MYYINNNNVRAIPTYRVLPTVILFPGVHIIYNYYCCAIELYYIDIIGLRAFLAYLQKIRLSSPILSQSQLLAIYSVHLQVMTPQSS